MKSIKQLLKDPRVFRIALNPDYDPRDDWCSKYHLFLNYGWKFDDESTFATADTVKELNDLMNDIIEGYPEGWSATQQT